MKATNYIKLEGNIGMDITTGATKNGKAWCRFPLGVNNVRLNRETGEYETTDTVWMWVSVFDKEAERLVEYMGKGSHITVEGYLKSNSWTDENGLNHQGVQVIAEKLYLPVSAMKYFMKKRKEKETGESRAASQNASRNARFAPTQPPAKAKGKTPMTFEGAPVNAQNNAFSMEEETFDEMVEPPVEPPYPEDY